MLCGLIHLNRELWNGGGRMVKVTLGVDSKIIKSNLFLLGLECLKERRYLSRTLPISPGQRQPRCFPVKSTHQAYTACLEQERGRPQQHELAWGMCKCEDSQQRESEAFGKAAMERGHLWANANCPSHLYQRAVADLSESSSTESVCSGLCSDGQCFWCWGSVRSGRHTDQAMHHEYQQPCLGQVLSSAAGLVQWSTYEFPEGKITAFEESYDPNKQTMIVLSINYILLEIKPRLFLREIFFPTFIPLW